MAKFSISSLSTEELSDSKLTQLFVAAKTGYENFFFEDLNVIFEVAKANRKLFPSINIAETEDKAAAYMVRWVNNYYMGIQNVPSKREASPRSTCSDPIVSTIVSTAKGLEEQEIKAAEINHVLFMSAENVQGGLLEEYIALQVRPYGWIWCAGEVLHAIDFCNSDGSVLLQIKNKYNSENSSSSSVREGTTIKKWYRLGVRTQNGKKFPKYKWEVLNEIIDTYKTKDIDESGEKLPQCNMNETLYSEFIKTVIAKNKSIISDE